MRLDEITRGVRLSGHWPGSVEVVAIERHSDSAATLVLRHEDGTLTDEVITDDDLREVQAVAAKAQRWTFDADPHRFRLAMEALRIRMAGAHDPMIAVASSNIDPLPHQIRAVYGELLPRAPLRFLLADDPGAGKTVMAGLFAKELMLRGDLARMLIIAPGGLVEQWQDELDSKFGLSATLLSRELINVSVDGDPFTAHPLLIARMDQLARNDDLIASLGRSEWDLVVVDEAHRMSASWSSNELRTTKRYELGQLLGSITRHLLLMTATPHSGSVENFQAFLALLDPDRFEGQFRGAVHSTDTDGLMRRMVKEDLLTFEGRRLFPERIAETVPYQLSAGERELYDRVTHYVREEMNRVEQQGDSPQRRTVGFALTVLQRRLASSTHAILTSLQRRRDRLATKRTELVSGRFSPVADQIRLARSEMYDDEEMDSAERESIEDEVVDAATASRTVAELDLEIRLLDDLVALATRVRDSGVDRKWAEVNSLLTDRNILRANDGSARKLIIFTEHRDTLEYLVRQIRNVLGRDDAVVTIHGGTSRSDRKMVREQFTHEPSRQVLVATDAAGEGLNLQAAHLMINYDLPWNPNRIEQRFGRIHRIGQRNVCRLWNIIADDTREGQVYTRLLSKMEQQRIAYGGKLFDVLGEAFTERPLRTLLMEAIRYGDDPKRLAEIEEVVEATVADGCRELVEDRALARESLDPVELERLRLEMDEAHARRLQPHFIGNFFRTAFAEIGGRLLDREKLRYQISNIPPPLRHAPGGRPVAAAYERVTFEPTRVDHANGKRAELIAPGHPLLDSLIDLTIDRQATEVGKGAVLFDESSTDTDPYVLLAMTGEIVDGTQRVVSKRFAFVAVSRDGRVTDAGPAPHLDLAIPPAFADAAIATARESEWLGASVRSSALAWAAGVAQPRHLQDVRSRLVPALDKTRAAVRSRLISQINHLDGEAARLIDDEASGLRRRRRLSPDTLTARARDLEARLEARMRTLDAEAGLAARPPRLTGAMLVIPAGMVGGEVGRFARDTTITERKAVDTVLAAERALGRDPVEMPHNNKGYDIVSTAADGSHIFIEVKGRVVGASSFFISVSEVVTGQNTAQNHRLALVAVDDGDGPHDVRYLTNHFERSQLDGIAVTRLELDWSKTWSRGREPH